MSKVFLSLTLILNMTFIYVCDLMASPDASTPVIKLIARDTRKTKGRTYKGDRLNGLREGLWTTWDPEGHKIREDNWVHDRLKGLSQVWHPNGNLSSIGYYDDNKMVGSWKFFYENGQKMMEGRYIKNTKSNGNPMSLMNGTWKYWYPDGNPLEISGLLPKNEVLENAGIKESQNCLYLFLRVHREGGNGYPYDYAYIQRPEDNSFKFYYKGEGQGVPLLGNKGNLLLVQTHNCSNCNFEYLHNLKTGIDQNFDREVWEDFNKHYQDPNGHVAPRAIAFSPEDDKMLVEMRGAYVVDTNNGHILHEYNIDSVPEKWWSY